MFTILVASIIIIVGMMLIVNLVKTEESINNQIYSMYDNYKLNDIAAIARSDAIQTFNYKFRTAMEEYLSNDKLSETGFAPIYAFRSRDDLGMDKLKSTFFYNVLTTPLQEGEDVDVAKGRLMEQIAEYVSDSTIKELVTQKSYGTKYYVRLDVASYDNTGQSTDSTTDLDNAKNSFKEVLLEAVDEENITADEFLQLIDCDEGSCENGSFYLKIPLSKVNPEVFDKLPKIIVKDLITKEEIKFHILPKNDLLIYFPTRYFKVLYNAQKVASEVYNENELKDLMLGACDGGCNSRTNIDNALTGDRENGACGETVTITNNELDTYQLSTSYEPDDPIPGLNILQAISGMRVCDSIYGSNEDVRDEPFYNFNVFNFPTVSPTGLSANSTIIPVSQSTLNLTAINCPAYKISTDVFGTKTVKISNGGDEISNARLSCSALSSVSVQTVYVETDDKYIINGQKRYFKIGIFKELNNKQNMNFSEPICVNTNTTGEKSCKSKK